MPSTAIFQGCRAYVLCDSLKSSLICAALASLWPTARAQNALQRTSPQACDRSIEAAAFQPEPAAMETEPTKVSVKTMKETIRRAGLSTADMLEKRDIEARYKQAQARC